MQIKTNNTKHINQHQRTQTKTNQINNNNKTHHMNTNMQNTQITKTNTKEHNIKNHKNNKPLTQTSNPIRAFVSSFSAPAAGCLFPVLLVFLFLFPFFRRLRRAFCFMSCLCSCFCCFVSLWFDLHVVFHKHLDILQTAILDRYKVSLYHLQLEDKWGCLVW